MRWEVRWWGVSLLALWLVVAGRLESHLGCHRFNEGDRT